MRTRSAVLLVLAALLSTLFALRAPLAHASDVVLAQESETEGSDQGDESDSGATDEDEGSGSSEAEVGSNEGQSDPAAEETGPPWTYQMARMIVALAVLMALGIAFLYWRLVVQRQRRGI